MRFRKRIKVFPGFHLSFSNSGISSSVGVKGASLTFNKKGTYLNTSIPGTGIYSRQKIGNSTDIKEGIVNSSSNITAPHLQKNEIEHQGIIKSSDRDTLTSSNLLEMKQLIKEAFHDRRCG